MSRSRQMIFAVAVLAVVALCAGFVVADGRDASRPGGQATSGDDPPGIAGGSSPLRDGPVEGSGVDGPAEGAGAGWADADGGRGAASGDLPVVPATADGRPTPEVVGRGAASGDLPVVPATGGAPAPAGGGEGPADDDVAAAQRRLADLRYYAGPIDGDAGPATFRAVQAFQKVQGLPVDGVLGAETVAALADPVLPAMLPGPADRIEIDLDAQVLFAVIDGQLARIMPISSGNGYPYSLPGGVRAESLTPVGSFVIERRAAGLVDAYFGRLYDAMWFHQGWAIHGSNNVPPVPASHGCVRLNRPDAAWLFEQVEVGTTVLVRGERNAFNPALGETAGTTQPAADPGPAPPPPPPPPPGPQAGG